MSESRAAIKPLNIDMNVHFLYGNAREFRKISLITDYIVGKNRELYEYNEEHHIDSSILGERT